MAEFLIAFPRAAMLVADDRREAVVHDGRAVIEDAKAAARGRPRPPIP